MAASDELTTFVRDALGRGRSRTEVEGALRAAGWSEPQVSRALAAFAAVDFPVPVPRPRASLSAKEAFMYLLLFTTLYLTAFNLGALIFHFIELAIPDVAARRGASVTLENMRWSVSTLIVSLPVFLYMARLTERATRVDPSKRISPVRRWLTYLTLFVSACVLIGDVVNMVHSFLAGELTARFLLKVLTVAVIAGAAFWYYVSDLRRDETDASA